MEYKLRPSEISASSHCSASDPSLNSGVNHFFTQMCTNNLQAEESYLLPLETQSHRMNSSINQIVKNSTGDWDAKTMLNNLSLLKQKIHQVQDIIASIVNQKSQLTLGPNELVVQQQIVTTDLTSIIVDLISTAGNLLPTIRQNLLSSNPSPEQPCSKDSSSTSLKVDAPLLKNEHTLLEKEKSTSLGDCAGELHEFDLIEDHDVKESEDAAELDNLPPGSYEVLQLEKEEILAPHTHFCSICAKGFKRDANLRMHMRGHGDEYKTPAALSKPTKDPDPTIIKRYSCPFVGCKRNKEHKNFHPLKTLLCVRNHYKRSHCEKSYMCSRCLTKKFSVLADLKTHEKHCGLDKWLCSCGTTFSRKDKLFGHVALFQGHAPVLPIDEGSYGSGSLERQNDYKVGVEEDGLRYYFSTNYDNGVINDTKACDDGLGYLSFLSFEPNDYGVSDEFMKAASGLMENSSFLSS
uniref:Zinc finger protein stop1-like protein isoform X2 n=1 Tax=Cymbidium ensifolium TaxID=78740 RepID=A0A5B9MNZ5_CYMEN|nr:zinc finger protein stop1-like protein isoform X2 [Cymbidium ensifolium]QEG03096.1 zinc finger protein stop1-like protein isoform X4 [Cymbidium ensifolium]